MNKRSINKYSDRNCFVDNYSLVHSLQTPPRVKLLMNMIDRRFFCIDEITCYCDKPSKLLMNQTISAPHMHAKALEYLLPALQPGSHVLDVGSGSGYLTACFAKQVQVNNPDYKKRGKVVGIDIYKSLLNLSNKTIQDNYPELMRYPSRCKLIHGSGRFGYPKKSKKKLYDAIHIGASSTSIPLHLINQLKDGGIMVIPLQLHKNETTQTFCKITKTKDNELLIEEKEKVRYVPLIK